MDTTEETKTRKKPGPVAQGFGRYNVTIEPDLAEWAKYQPGGMSETIRRALREAKEKVDRKR